MHLVMGMSQGSEELAVSPGCQSCVIKLERFSLKMFSYVKRPLRTDVTAASLQMCVHFSLLEVGVRIVLLVPNCSRSLTGSVLTSTLCFAECSRNLVKTKLATNILF